MLRDDRVKLGPVRPWRTRPGWSRASYWWSVPRCWWGRPRRRSLWARFARPGKADVRDGLGPRPAHSAGGEARMTDHKADRPHGSGRPRRPSGPGNARTPVRVGRRGPVGRRRIRRGRPRTRRLRLCTATTRTRNLVLAEILRDMRLAGRDGRVRDRVGLRTLRSLGTLDLIVAAAPAARWPGSTRRPRRVAAGRLPAAAHPGAGARRGQPDR